MKTKLLLLLLATFSVGILAGCATHPASSTEKLPANAAQALADTTTVTLYSLEPAVEDESHKGYYGYKVLGKVELQGAEAKKAAGAFQQTIANGGAAAACFEPRHALRIKADNHVYDYLLCYACNGMIVDEDKHSIANLTVSGSPDTLNALLTKHHIPLAKKQQ